MKDKSQAINEMARQYREVVLEFEFKPQYVRKLKKIQGELMVRVGNARDLRKRYGLK